MICAHIAAWKPGTPTVMRQSDGTDRERASMRLNGYLLKNTVVAAFGGLLFGFDAAVISGTTATLTQTYGLSRNLLGFTVASALWGTVLGAMLAGIPGDRLGRRNSLRLMAVLYFVSAVGCALAWNWPALISFRFLGGIAIGGSSVLGPMYIAEISPAQMRGRLVGIFQFNVVFGILLAYFSNYLIGLREFGLSEWRWELGIIAIPAALFFLMLFGIPESPRWLVKQGRVPEAAVILEATGVGDFKRDLQEIVDSLRDEHNQPKGKLFSRIYAFPIFLAVTIAMFNQLSGINAILFYLNDIFAHAGFSKVSGNLQAVAVGGTNLLFTMIAMSVIDKLGRRTLLLLGSVGTAICLAGVSLIFFTGRHQSYLIWLLIGYIACFAFSQGAVIWVYLSEVFPNAVRAKGQSLGSFSHWFMSALIAWTFPRMAASSGGYPFVFFSAMMVLQFFVVLFVYPETKGVTLENMQKKLVAG
jgi:SP family arabinose:H+ symporter-like MFS transporter